MLNGDGLVTSWSEDACRLYGYAEDDILGSPIALVEADGHEGDVRRHLHSAPPPLSHFHSQHRTARGEAVPVDVILAVVPGAAGDSIHCLVHVLHPASELEQGMLTSGMGRMGDSLVAVDEQGRITHWNAAAERMYGWSAEEAIGRRIDTLMIEPEELEFALSEMRSRTDVYERGELKRRRRDGAIITVSINAWPRWVNGRFAGFAATGFDITSRRESEQAMAQLAAIVESSEDAISSMTPDGRIISWNPAAERMWGQPASEMVGQYVSPAIHRELDRSLDRAAAGHPPEAAEVITHHRDGSEVVVSLTISPIRDPDGTIVGAASIARDISKQRELNRAREEALRDLEEAQRLARIGSWTLSPDHTLTWSRQMYEMYELDPAGGLPSVQEQYARIRPEHHERVRWIGRRIAEGRDIEPVEMETTKGRVLVTRARRDPARGGTYVGTVQDVTEERAAEQERLRLLEATARAASANRAKSEFLARMSHELRTPLNAIIGFGQLLELEDLELRQREDIGFILRAGNHLLELINDVLDIAQIEAGRMTISSEPVPVRETVRSAVEMVEPLARERGVDLHLEEAELGADGHVQADVNRLTQVLLNLLSNAIKYNRRGGSVRVGIRNGGDSRLRIAIRDSGPGIAADKLDQLFEPFERLGAEQTEIEGTGLGLTLSRGLVEAMGGTIAVVSELGAGSTFTVELPAAAAPTARHMITTNGADRFESDPDDAERRLVLYIEDNRSNLALVERLLQRAPGVELITAVRGSLGLELIRRHQPDLVLLDLHLPDMGGLDVLRHLRAIDTTTPVIVITANAIKGQAEMALEHGATDFLTKPLDAVAFLDVVTENLSSRNRES